MGKFILLSIAAAALAGCSYAPPPAAPPLSAKAQAQLGQLLAGKVAGQPQSCLPLQGANDMIVIDEYTIAYRDGVNRVWINKPQGGCRGLGRGYALVTQRTTSTLCSGEIGQVIDPTSGVTLGSCVLSEFTPYTRP